ncbi:hypothetical protein [Algoriphagus litoralis]|uniref:hypothetical protein n=1 Tax=Algoriphagus litoralis TaxID=2202829 RepID=UPI000DB9B620|nr:hypothetical protein [Algoriphagus litoralis]
MNHLPKLKDFEAPEGYFDRLPDQILVRSRVKKQHIWIRVAAAASIIIGLGLSWQAGVFKSEPPVLSAEEVANLYIESQVWTAEDILSMTDDPNAILDQIIEEEMPLSEDLWTENELNWF